jgi:uncharacterized metal-binding protein
MTDREHEIVRIEKTPKVCPMCEDYARRNTAKPVVVMCCEGACLRGEVARRAANLLCHRLAPETTVRLCLGGAFTKDGGQRGLARNAPRLLAIEGCFLECATRMMKGVTPEASPEMIIADKLYQFDRRLFGIDEMPDEEINRHAEDVARAALAVISTPAACPRC